MPGGLLARDADEFESLEALGRHGDHMTTVSAPLGCNSQVFTIHLLLPNIVLSPSNNRQIVNKAYQYSFWKPYMYYLSIFPYTVTLRLFVSLLFREGEGIKVICFSSYSVLSFLKHGLLRSLAAFAGDQKAKSGVKQLPALGIFAEIHKNV